MADLSNLPPFYTELLIIMQKFFNVCDCCCCPFSHTLFLDWRKRVHIMWYNPFFWATEINLEDLKMHYWVYYYFINGNVSLVGSILLNFLPQKYQWEPWAQVDWMPLLCCEVGYWCWSVCFKQKPVSLDDLSTDNWNMLLLHWEVSSDLSLSKTRRQTENFCVNVMLLWHVS